jgi:hypothetical protein
LAFLDPEDTLLRLKDQDRDALCIVQHQASGKESISSVSIGRDVAMREGEDVASGMGGTQAVG